MGQSVSLAKTSKSTPAFLRLHDPNGTFADFRANSGSLTVMELVEDGKSVPRHIRFWMTDIRRWGDPPT